MKNGTKFELKQLPLMLGKLASGILAVIGFGGLVYITTRPPGPSGLAVVSYAAAFITGIALFVLCSRQMSSRSGQRTGDTEGSKSTVSKVIPWVIFLLLAAIFIIVMLLI